MANSAKIESLGIDYLNLLINKNECLQSYITTNDRTPIWDGSIHVLKENSSSKSDILGTVPVQVKSSTRKTRLNKFDMNITDLKAYQSEGGAVLFVVFISDNNELRKICFKSILPVTVKKILKHKDIKPGTQQKITLDIYDLEEAELYPTLLDFLDHRKKQFSFFQQNNHLIESTPKDKEFRFYFRGSSPTSVFNYQRKHEIFPYVFDEATGIEIPVANSIEIASILENTDLVIKIGENQIFKDVKRIRNSDGSVELKFGPGFSISVLSRTDKKFSFSYERPSKLPDAISNTQSLIEFSEKGYIYIDEQRLDFENENLKQLEGLNLNNELKELNKLKSSLEELGITKPLELSEFDNKSRSHLLLLEDGLINNKKVSLNFDESKLMNIRVGNLHFLLLYHQTTPKDGYLINIFKDTPWCRSTDEAVNDTEDISLFELFSIDDWVQIDNCDFDAVISSYNRLLDTTGSKIDANDTLVRIISAYDKIEETNKKLELLKWANQLSDWNIAHSHDKPRTMINHLQLKQRQEELSDVDVEKLNSLLLKYQTEAEICFGIAVLLGTRRQADLYWKKMSGDMQEAYKDFPIYNLYCKLV